MRYLLSFLSLLTGLSLSARSVADVSGLPHWTLADTEVSTNVPFATGPDVLREFRFSLDLDATPSNAVAVVFGRDVNTNGVLDLDEEGLSIGWDAGRWVVRPGFGTADLQSGFAFVPMTSAESKRLEWRESVRRSSVRRLDAKENGSVLDLAASGLPNWTWDDGWNMVKLVARGAEPAAGRFRAKVIVAGTLIQIR